jgi:Tfp pilus assembly protein PilX
MRLVRKYLFGGKKSEDGFVLIAAILATMIMIALGLYALSTTTQDMKISSRLVAERKAFSAAECGLHTLCLTFDPAMAALSNQSCDAANDPNNKFDIAAPTRNSVLPSVTAIGADITGGKKWVSMIFDTTITGRDQSYNSSVPVSVGIKFGPVPDDPSYH